MYQAKTIVALATMYLLSSACVDTEVTCEELVTCPYPSPGGTSGAAGETGGMGGHTASDISATTSGRSGGGPTATSAGPTSSSGGSDSGGRGTGGEADNGTSASTVGSGGTGGSVVVPCDGACDGDTPQCNEETGTCVECLESEDCEDGVCDTEANVCVECLDTEDCETPTPLCDTEGQFCVECLANTDCHGSQESACDAGSCSPCQTNDHCAHLTGSTVCDVNSGQCVQCTIADEAVCGGTSCNPTTNTCTTTELGTVDDCQPCVADSDCIGHDQSEPLRRCVPMEFNGEPREKAYCLVRRSQVSECARPFVVGITAASLSGAPEELYCGIAQESVTCEAVQDFLLGRSCPGGQDTECGCPRDEDGNCMASGQGGLCRDSSTVDDRCTYECGDVLDCPSNKSCANQDPDFCE